MSPLLISACSGNWKTDYNGGIDADVSRNWRASEVTVIVPQTLTVSESNTLAPNADIVWHGDPLGDRRVQVRELIGAGIAHGASGLQGSRPVEIRAIVSEMHAVTPAAVSRAPAAVHNISFSIQVFDSRNGRALTDVTQIDADLPAYVGAAAVVAAQQGQTQKVRITNHVAAVVRGWLGQGSDPRNKFGGVGR